jgi:hypothetical protein
MVDNLDIVRDAETPERLIFACATPLASALRDDLRLASKSAHSPVRYQIESQQ